jgi:hypothetical protein
MSRETIQDSTIKRLSKYRQDFQKVDDTINTIIDQLEDLLKPKDQPTKPKPKPKPKISTTKKTKGKKGKKATYDFDEDVQRSS